MFKEKIRYLRRMRDLTQAQTAKLLNISTTGYASWEQGLAEPSIEDIKKLCVIFNITADELLEIETDEQRKHININNSTINNNGTIKF